MDVLRIHNLYFIFIISLILSLFTMKFVIKNIENIDSDKKNFKSILLFIKFILLIFSLFIILWHLIIFLIIFIILLIIIFIKNIDTDDYPYFRESFEKLKNLLLSQVSNSDFIILISYYIASIAVLSLSWLIYNRVYKKTGADYGKTNNVTFDEEDNIINDDIENPEKHYYWFSIYLITTISFIILLLASKYDNIQFSITLFFITLYYVLYLLHINYRIKKKNIKSFIILALLIILFGINAFIFNKY